MELLKTIAYISLGVNFRSRLEASANGPIGVIQMKDIDENHTIDTANLTKIDENSVSPTHFISDGDLIFRSCGASMTAAVCRGDIGSIVVSSPLLRIEPNADIVDSLYLQWYINHPRTQRHL